MASCEKCWEESGGDSDKYHRLLKSRICTPEESAGPNATQCPKCERRTLHQHVGVCMQCGYDKESRHSTTKRDEEEIT